MKVGKLGTHALFVGGFAALSSLGFAESPTFRRIIESGQATPDGRPVGQVGPFSRTHNTFAFAAETTPQGDTHAEWSIYRESSVHATPKLAHRIAPRHLGNGFYTNVTNVWSLHATSSELGFKATYHDPDPDDPGNPYDPKEYTVFRQFSPNGNVITQMYEGSNFSPVGDWTYKVDVRGYVNGKPVAYIDDLAESGDITHKVTVAHLQGTGTYQTLSSGYFHRTWDSEETFLGWTDMSHIDPITSSFLLYEQDISRKLRISEYKNGARVDFRDAKINLPDGSYMGVPRGRFLDGTVSGATFIRTGDVFKNAIAIVGRNSHQILWKTGDAVEGYPLGAGPDLDDPISHFGGSAVWLGDVRVTDQTSKQAIFISHMGSTKVLIRAGDELFGGKIDYFRLQEDSLQRDGLTFWYRLTDGRTGIAYSNAVPEPGTLAALGLGSLLLRRRRTHRSTEGI